MLQLSSTLVIENASSSILPLTTSTFLTLTVTVVIDPTVAGVTVAAHSSSNAIVLPLPASTGVGSTGTELQSQSQFRTSLINLISSPASLPHLSFADATNTATAIESSFALAAAPLAVLQYFFDSLYTSS